MAQKLIVEGKDAIVLSVLRKVRNCAKPLGYADESKYRYEFITEAGGYTNALVDFGKALKNSTFQNIGLIIDANSDGVLSRWDAVKQRLSSIFTPEELAIAAPNEEGIVLQKDNLTVGIWIMPNNSDPGYLEHFVTDLINDDTGLWEYTQKTVNELATMPFSRFGEVKKQKVLAHTWLAWQSSPGLPFGSALQAGFLDADAAVALPFLNWFEKTFQLEKLD